MRGGATGGDVRGGATAEGGGGGTVAAGLPTGASRRQAARVSRAAMREIGTARICGSIARRCPNEAIFDELVARARRRRPSTAAPSLIPERLLVRAPLQNRRRGGSGHSPPPLRAYARGASRLTSVGAVGLSDASLDERRSWPGSSCPGRQCQHTGGGAIPGPRRERAVLRFEIRARPP